MRLMIKSRCDTATHTRLVSGQTVDQPRAQNTHCVYGADANVQLKQLRIKNRLCFSLMMQCERKREKESIKDRSIRSSQ
jgi:hypothetical protein